MSLRAGVAVIVFLSIVLLAAGCAPDATPRPVAAAVTAPPVELRQLIDSGSLALVRRALADDRSTYAVRLEAVRQCRRLRTTDLADLLRRRVELSRDPCEQAAALDVFFDVCPDRARADAAELSSRSVDLSGDAALVKAIVVHRCEPAYPLAARSLLRMHDDVILFHLRPWLRSDGPAMAAAMRDQLAEGAGAVAALAQLLALAPGERLDDSVLASAGYPPRALRAQVEAIGAAALPTVRAALASGGDARVTAIDLVGELGDAESIEAVSGILADSSGVDERAACLRALGRLRSEAALPEIISGSRDRTERTVLGGVTYPIAEAAAQGLAPMPQPEAHAALIAALAEAVRPSLVSALATALVAQGDRTAVRALEAARERLWTVSPRAADACGVASDDLMNPPSGRILAYVIAYRCGDRQVTILTDTPLQPASGPGEQVFGIDAPDAVAQESFLLPLEDIPRAIQARNSRRLDRLHYLGCAIDAVDLLAR